MITQYFCISHKIFPFSENNTLLLPSNCLQIHRLLYNKFHNTLNIIISIVPSSPFLGLKEVTPCTRIQYAIDDSYYRQSIILSVLDSCNIIFIQLTALVMCFNRPVMLEMTSGPKRSQWSFPYKNEKPWQIIEALIGVSWKFLSFTCVLLTLLYHLGLSYKRYKIFP